MKNSTIVRLAVISWWLTLLLAIGMVVFGLLDFAGDPYLHGDHRSDVVSALAAIVVFQSMATIGYLIVSRDARNAVGWIFCASPVLMMAANTLGAYAEYVLNVHPGAAPGGRLAAQLGVSWIAGLTLFVSFVLLLFPDGRLPGRRWRPVAWIGGIGWTCLWVGLLFAPTTLEPPLERFQSPIGIAGAQYIALGGVVVPFTIVTGVVAGIVRYRRGTTIERLQLRWFIASVAVFPVFLALTALLDAVTGVDLPDFVFLSVLLLTPISVGIAILRYRLYEIDVIIRKTLVYAGLVVTLAALYLGGVYVIGTGLRALTGGSSALAVTLSTLAVAVAFQPLRSRIQRAVDHRFYRRRYDASRTLDQFSSRLREQIDLDALREEMLVTVNETVQPRHATVWLRPAE